MEVRVDFRKGGLEAVALLAKGPLELEEAVQSVEEQLRQKGVVDPPTAEQIRGALAGLANGSEVVVVARGAAPQPGVGAQLLPFFPTHDTPLGEGTDPFLAFAGNVTYPDETVLQKTPASPGVPGTSLFGTPLPGLQGKDIPVVAGDGVVVADEEEGSFRSTSYGVVLFHKGVLRVADAVQVSEDRMAATITVIPDPEVDEPGQIAKLGKALQRLEVTHGVDREALVKAVRNARTKGQPVHNVAVARGQKPVDGRETDYRLLIDPDKKVGKLLEGGRIDFREAETVKNVTKGTPLAEVVPGVEPVPGFRIDGSPMRAKMERAQGLKPGQNTVPSEDGLQIVSGVDGMVVVKDGKFHVSDEYLLRGDVDYHTGNIRASGIVRVRGQVKPGFHVIGGKDVEIAGDVEEAAVEAGHSAAIAGGVTAGSRVVAGRDVSCKYLLNSTVECGGNLEVRLSVTNSRVYARGRVLARGNQGILLGGEVNAAMGIEARTIGSASSQTHVAVGVDLRMIREREAIEKEQNDLREEMLQIQGSLGKAFLKDPRGALLAIPASLRKPKLMLLQRFKEVHQRHSELSARLEELDQMDQEMKNAQIAVHAEIHAGTAITMGKAQATLQETLRRVLLYNEGDRVLWKRL